MAMTVQVGAIPASAESNLFVLRAVAPRSASLRVLADRTFIQVFPEYVQITGSMTASMILGWLVYWFLPAADGRSKVKTVRDGKRWIYRTYAELSRDTGMTKMQCLKARAILEGLKLIEVRDGSFNGHRSLSWHLDLKYLNDLLGARLHSSAKVEDADDVMAAEFEEVTVEAVAKNAGQSYQVHTTLDSTSTQPSSQVPPTVGQTSIKPIKKSTEESGYYVKSSGAASQAQKPVSEKHPIFKTPLLKNPDFQTLNAKLDAVRAKYGRNLPKLAKPKAPNTPHVPWRGIFAKVRPGSGGLRIKKVESPMALSRPPGKFASKLLTKPTQSAAAVVDSMAFGVHSSAGNNRLRLLPHLPAMTAEILWKKCIGNQHGFMGPFTLKERGQMGQLSKKLTGDAMVSLFEWLLAPDLTKDGGTRWALFVTTAQTEDGASGGPAVPHVGFLLAHYAAAMRLYNKPAPTPVGLVVKTSPPAPDLGTPLPPASIQEVIDDMSEAFKIQIGRAVLKGMKPPPDLTAAQVEEYKKLAISKDPAYPVIPPVNP